MVAIQHVDLVQNEWLAGFQRVVARIHAEGDGLHIDSPDIDTWGPIVRRTFDDRGATTESPRARAEQFLGTLHDQIRGDYLFATDLHDEAACPFHGGMVATLQPVRQNQPQAV